MSPTRDQIQPGDQVYSSDDDLIGTVAEIQATHFVVESDGFPTEYAIPVTAITQAGNGEVILNVAMDAILHSGWDTVPTSASDSLRETATFSTDVMQTADVRGTADAAAEGAIVIPLQDEDLIATVRAAPDLVARIQTRVVTEEQVPEEPVTEPQIRVERRFGENELGAFEEILITVPLTAREVALHKQARVAEELIVTRETIHRTRQVRGTVRHEEVDVVEDVTPEAIHDRDHSA